MPSFDSPPHFILPLFHPDYVVLGDPEARTHVGIHLSPSFLTLSANWHGSLSHVSQSEIATVTCGGHFVLSLEGCSLEGAVAMYGGDDLEDHMQHTSLQVKVCVYLCMRACVCVCVYLCMRACLLKHKLSIKTHNTPELGHLKNRQRT